MLKYIGNGLMELETARWKLDTERQVPAARCLISTSNFDGHSFYHKNQNIIINFQAELVEATLIELIL